MVKEEPGVAGAGLPAMQAVLDAMPSNIAVLDAGGRILLVNRSWKEFALANGGTSEDVGADYLASVPLEEGELRKGLLDVLAGGSARSFDYTCDAPDRRRWFRMTATPLDGPAAFLVNHVDITHTREAAEEARDVTALRRAQEAEARARKADSLVLMAGSIAHDFNNLFAGLSAGLEIIAMQARSPEDVLQGVATTKAVLTHAVALSWKMNDFSGQGIVRMARVELGDLLRRWAPASGARHGGGTPLLELEMAAPVKADAARLEAALDAIVANAWEAMDDAGVAGGRVRVRLFMDRGEDGPAGGEGLWAAERPGGAWTVCLEIANEGPWPGPEILSRMFDPFFTTHFVGRGLGLASVLGVLQSHAAGIHVLPAPGGGLAFRIHFLAH